MDESGQAERNSSRLSDRCWSVVGLPPGSCLSYPVAAGLWPGLYQSQCGLLARDTPRWVLHYFKSKQAVFKSHRITVGLPLKYIYTVVIETA